MTLRYVTTNLLNSSTLPADNATYRSSEDATYQVENLYNKRPSYPFRWTGRVGEWVKIQLTQRQVVSFVGAFNHNLTSAANVQLHSSNVNGAWNLAANITWRQYDMYAMFGRRDLWWRFSVGDAGNADLPEIGELVLGEYATFENAKVQPGRADGPVFNMADAETDYGQDWNTYLSEAERFSIKLRNINDVSAVDDIQTFLTDIFSNSDGKFVLIPDDAQPHCYYVQVTNRDAFSEQQIYGDAKELRAWSLELKTLVRGITLL